MGVNINQVACIIVHYSSLLDTHSCVTSLINGGFPAHQVYISDNSPNWDYQAVYSETVLRGPNVGFSGGVNRVLREISGSFDWYLVLNNDAKIDYQNVMAMLAEGIHDSSVGFLTPTVLSHDGSVWSQGGKISWLLGRAYQIGLGSMYQPTSRNSCVEVDYPPGCVVLVRDVVVERVGLMDESYFMYWEEVDWAVRAKRQGYKSVWVPNAIAYHESAWRTTGIKAGTVLAMSMINSRKFFKKYGGHSRWLGSWLLGVRTILSAYKRGVFNRELRQGFLEGLVGKRPDF